jgi:outer membrane protein
MKRLGRAGAVAVGALTLVGAGAAQAQTDDSASDVTFFGYTISGHISARISPDYLGSKSYSLGPGGSLALRKPGAESSFHAPDDSPSLHLLGNKTFSAGVVLRGRSSRDDKGVLAGVHKLRFALEPGVYAEWWPADGFRLHSEVRRGVMGNSAWSGDVSADLVHDDPKWVLSLGPRLHLGDPRFTQTYFDITAADAARSPIGLSPFTAHRTYVAAGGFASAEYRWSRRWSLLADAGYQRLLGDAADSPIVARVGSPNQFTGSVGVRYSFGR